MRTAYARSLLVLALIAGSIAAGAAPTFADSTSFTLEPSGITPDGNGLINDMVITVSNGSVSGSGSGTRNWLGDNPGESTAQITGTYDAETGALHATYTGSHKNTREAGDIVQDVLITFTGQADVTINPADREIQMYFKGPMTTKITGGPSNPPDSTREHSVGGVYAIQGRSSSGAGGAGSTTPAKANSAAQPGSSDGGSGGGDSGGGFPLLPVLIAIFGVAIAAVLIALWKAGVLGGKGQDGPAEDEGEEEGSKVILQLTYPAGRSPRVFTSGWVFGARCVSVTADGDETDYSEAVEWSGSGEFEPAIGPRSRPSFASEGANTIALACDVNGRKVRKTFTVDAVSPAGYASIGTYSHCPFDAHGCPACPHPVTGPVSSGSSLVTANGKAAARQGDSGVHYQCCGSNTFTITEGDPSVLIEGRPAARIGDRTEHCGGTGTLVSAQNVGEITRNIFESEKPLE